VPLNGGSCHTPAIPSCPETTSFEREYHPREFLINNEKESICVLYPKLRGELGRRCDPVARFLSGSFGVTTTATTEMVDRFVILAKQFH